MPNDTEQAQEQTEETTVEAMPTSNQPAEQEAAESQPLQVEDGLPDGVSERTKAEFEKLKEHNKKLAEENALLKGPQRPKETSVLDGILPIPQTQNYLQPGQAEQIAQSYVDSDGYVDVDAVQKAIATANKAAKDANDRAQRVEERVARYEQNDEVKKAHSMFPALDPYNENFDQKFYDLVRNELLGQMVKGEQDLVKAAKKVKTDLYDPDSIKAQIKATEEAQQKQKVTQKVQATANPGQTKSNLSSSGEQAELVSGTIKGDRDALYKRLQASGY